MPSRGQSVERAAAGPFGFGHRPKTGGHHLCDPVHDTALPLQRVSAAGGGSVPASPASRLWRLAEARTLRPLGEERGKGGVSCRPALVVRRPSTGKRLRRRPKQASDAFEEVFEKPV